MSLHPVILCGGAGTRLWPASRPSRPKQFLPLVGERSSFQQTVLRVAGLDGAAPPIIITGRAHLGAVESQLDDLAREAVILVEPAARDSAGAMAAAARWIEALDPAGVAIVLAADHHIPDGDAFRAALLAAAGGARDGYIVTLGVTPDHPSSAYGYIEAGEPLAIGDLRRVARFVEKPDEKAAADLVVRGALWNSGNFVASARVLIEELDRAAPKVLEAVTRAVREARKDGRVVYLSDAFLSAPKISIDYAVMERTARAAVLPVSFEWSDLGSWDAVRAASIVDRLGNVTHGEAILSDTRGALVRAAPGMLVATVGVRNLAIIADSDAVLVCDLAAAQQVKAVVEAVVAGGNPQVDVPPRSAPETLEGFRGWFARWLETSALPLWWTLGADHDKGGFFEALDQEGGALDHPRRARVQTRQTFVYAQAGAMGWRGPWRQAVDHGADHVHRAFARDDHLLRTLVSPSGECADDTPRLYDQAFGLLALAAEGPRREVDALRMKMAIEARFRHERGGLAESDAPRFVANPIMHLFEAALAWAEVGPDESWRRLADELGRFAMERLIDDESGAIVEIYDARWRPPARPADRVVSPGHQFEWAWLLNRWRGLGGDEAALTLARRLYRAGSRGVSSTTGLAMNAMNGAFEVTDGSARLWPQTEWLKAALVLAEAPGEESRKRYLDDAIRAAAAIRRYLDTPVPGLWIDVIEADGARRPGQAPASSFYHLLGAIRTLVSSLA